MRKRVPYLLAAGIALAITLAACGNDYDSDKSSSNNEKQTAASTPASKPILAAANDDSLGTVVVDSNGFTLYRFDKDTVQPAQSNCNGSCAQKWPPVTAPANLDQTTFNGIDKDKVGTVTRADGTKQLTINGWPIYRYALEGVSNGVFW